MKNTKKWIQTIHMKKGSYRASVRRRYGKKGFTSSGTIKQSIINKDKRSLNPKLRKRAVLADTLRKRKRR